METYEIELVLIEEMLGTVPKDKEIYKNFIASKAPKPEEAEIEIETIMEEEKGWTGFHTVNGKPIIYDYVLKGFFKDACSMLTRVDKKNKQKNLSCQLRAFKKVIDGLVFIKPRKISIDLCGGEIGVNERPLRVPTPQGERVCLVRSDTVPAGSKLNFKIIIPGEVTEELLREWLDYGQLRGLGQWRNGGFGSFNYTMTRC